MNRVLVLLILVLTAVLPASGMAVQKEMKVKVFAAPSQIPAIAGSILEFYDVTPEFFVAGIGEDAYREMVSKGFRVEVLVPDVRARALELTAAFHTYEQIRDTWAIIAQNHPDICVLDTIGHSYNGNLLLVMKVSDLPREMEGEPRICFDFTIHGNENNATEIAHHALLDLVQKYGTDPDITRWVNTREIWLIPIVNPDGLIARQRYNGHGVDCNRNYGYSWDGGGPGVFSEPEVQALYHLGTANPMASWTQYHTGTRRAMWCWGYTTKAPMDSAISEFEMQRYEELTGLPAGQIARVLYSVHGGSTDWYYGATGALGFGIEVCNGQPSPPSEIDTINRANWTAMKAMIQRVVCGVSGRITDSMSGRPVEARVELDGPDWFTYSDTMGYFHKYVGEGTYLVRVVANGYQPKTIAGVSVPPDTSVWVDLQLVRDTVSPACPLRVVANKMRESPDNTNPTNAWWALGRRDGRRFSLGRGGWATFDMGRSTVIPDGPGNDFFVVEDDEDPEACSVYVSNEWNGPWHCVGFGTGTQGYDLAAASIDSARYVRIADDNIGGSGPYAGFDVDAVEAIVADVPTVVYHDDSILDLPPGGNNDGKLDPGESVDYVVTLRNAGRATAQGLVGVLRTDDQFVSVADSVAVYGDLGPDSVRSNESDRFYLVAARNTPQEHLSGFTLLLSGDGYLDSVKLAVLVGKRRNIDPIPDGPGEPAVYWAYDDRDTLCDQHPAFSWFEAKAAGTRINFGSNDAVVTVNLPSGFGPFRYYGQRYTQLSVSADGWIVPGSYTASAYSNTELPSSVAPPGAICPNWDDLYPGYSGAGYVYYYHDEPNHRFVVEFDSVVYYDNRTMCDKFEVLFYDTTMAAASGNSEFLFQYLTANGYGSNTVGIQNPDRSIGIQCLFDGDYNNGCWPLTPGRAILYTTDSPAGIAERTAETGPDRLALGVSSNPSVGPVRVSFSMARPGRARLAVYDGTGRRVRTLADGVCQTGRHFVDWDGGTDNGGVASGVYWIRFVSEGRLVTAKIIRAR